MNAKFTALTLAAATAFAFTPKPASAGNTGAAVVGGLIGGLIIGSAIADHHHDTRTVIVEDRCDDGYWDTVSVNVWVPAVWIVERDRYGRSCRRYVEGHYVRRNDRVWVARGGRDYNRYDGPRGGREIGRGPDRDRHDRNDRHDRR